MPNIYELDIDAANNSSVGGMNWAENQAPSTVNNSARQLSALIAQILDDIGGTLTAGGTANALTVTANSDFTAYADGRIIAFKASADNSAAATLNVNSVGAKAIRKMTSAGEAGLASGDIRNGYTYVVRYSTTANSAAGAWLLDWAPKEAARLDYVPVGSGMDFWGSTAPTGYLFAYGQAVSRTDYALLFAALGTTYGVGDGSTTFNLPDKRGRASFGKDNMGGTSANLLTDQTGGLNGDTLGDTGGAETVALTIAQMPSHNHGGSTSSTVTSTSFSTNTVSHTSTGQVLTGSGSDVSINAPTHSHTISSQGSGDAHNNLPPGIVCNYIIFAGV